MTKNLKQRLIALNKVGGTETLHRLPRGMRSHAIASILSEDPIKEKSKLAAATVAFESALEKNDLARAKALVGRFDIPRGTFEKIASKRVAELRAESEKGQSNTATEIEIIFRLEGYVHAATRVSDALDDQLTHARQKLRQGDYPFTHNHFTRILEKGELLDVRTHEKDAAAGLFGCWMKRGSLEDALDVVGKYLMVKGEVIPAARDMVLDEVGNYLMRVNEGALKGLVRMAREKGEEFVSLLQDSVRRKISKLDYTDTEKCEKLHSLSVPLGMKNEQNELSIFLVNAFISVADSQPDKFLEFYLKAADLASGLMLDDERDEAVTKYLAVCNKLGETNPKYLEEGMFAAMGFGFEDEFADLAEKAFYGYLAAGNLGRAEMIANESGSKDFLAYAKQIGRRTSL